MLNLPKVMLVNCAQNFVFDQFLNDDILLKEGVKKPLFYSKTSLLNGSFDISGIFIPYQVIIWQNFEIF